MTDTDPDDGDAVAAARRYLETSVERPDRGLADLPRVVDLLSTDDASGAVDRRLKRRVAASGALANLAHHDPARLLDATPALIDALRVELGRSLSEDDPDRRARSWTVREHLVSGLSRVLLADVGALADPDDLGVVVDALSTDLDDGAVRTATRALFAVAEDHPDRLAPAAESLANLLDHPDDAVAALCAGTLGRLVATRPEAVAAAADDLGDSLGRDGEAVQHNAVEALAALARRRPNAVAPLAGELRGLLDHDSVAIQHNATGVLGILAEERPAAVRPAVDDLRALRDHDDDAVRRVATGTLARLREADFG